MRPIQKIFKKNIDGHNLAIWHLTGATGDKRRNVYNKTIQFLNKHSKLKDNIKQRGLLTQQLIESPPFVIPNETGIKSFEPNYFEESLEIVEKAKALKDSMTRPHDQNTALTHLLNQEELDINSPFIRFALRPDVISSISHYLKIIPVLTHTNVYLTTNFGQDYSGNQLFHCDSRDVRQIKVFINCSDVGPDNGPFTAIKANVSKGIREKIRYQYEKKGYDNRGKRSLSEVYKFVGSEDVFTLKGPKGTSCFVDTSSCFHYGGRVAQGPAFSRLIAEFQFMSPISMNFPPRKNYKAKTPFAHLTQPEMPLFQQMVLGAY